MTQRHHQSTNSPGKRGEQGRPFSPAGEVGQAPLPEPDAPSGVFLRTFGDPALLRITPGGAPSVLIEPSKLLALIVFLSATPGRTATRDGLIDLLWADLDPDAGRHALRQHLWQLKRRLQGELVVEGRDQLVLVSRIPSDRSEFITASEAADFARAVALYRGDFFPGFAGTGAAEFERWADRERSDLRARFLRCAELHISDLLNAGRARDAVELAQRARDLEPLRQHAWRQLLEALLAARDVVSAKVEAESLTRMAQQEGFELESSTRGLIATIHRTDVPPVAASPAAVRTELVGREREFALLMQAWDSATRGHGVTVAITAKAGMGKTRLLTEFRARLQSVRARTVLIRASHGTSNIAFGLAADLADRLGRLPGARGVSPHALRILVGLSPSLSSLVDAVPFASAPPDAARHRLMALQELIGAVSAEQPLAILIDDLHWADTASAELIDGLRAGLGSSHVLLCVALRHQGAGMGPAADIQLALPPLAEAAVLTLMAGVADLPPTPWADRLPAELAEQTRGVPLFIVEFLHQAMREGLLAIDDGTWSTGRPDELRLLLKSGELLGRRLRGLSSPEWIVLRSLAVAGPLSADLLVAIRELDPGTLRAALDDLQRKGLLAAVQGGIGIVHDEIAAAILQQTSKEELLSACKGAGSALMRGTGDQPRQRRLAASLLVRAEARDDLRQLFQLHYAEARKANDPRARTTLAADLVGDGAPRDLIDELAASVPVSQRLRAAGIPRWAALAAIVLPSVAVGAFLTLSTRSAATDAWLYFSSLTPRGLAGYRIPLSRSNWKANEPLDVRDEHRVMRATDAAWFPSAEASPDGERWAGVHDAADSGGLDVYVVTARGRASTRLTFGRGDDVDPGWSPDGRWIVLSTSQWDTLGQTDLAIVSAAGGSARRLTDGSASDYDPAWSPDGSRIAFLRRDAAAAAEWQICIVHADGAALRCRDVPGGHPARIHRWDSDSSLVIRAAPQAPSPVRILADALMPDTTSWALRPESSGERWVVGPCPQGQSVMCVHPVGQPELVRSVVLPGNTQPAAVAIHHVGTARFVDRLDVRGGQAVVGVPYALEVTARDASGTPVKAHALRFRSLDPEVAVTDSLGYVLFARAGNARVEVSTGGWRVDTATLAGQPSRASTLLIEHWADGMARWRPFGDPRPAAADSVLTLGGNGRYHSGVYLAAPLDGTRGVNVRARIAAPISSRQWQYIAIEFTANVNFEALRKWSHERAYLWGIPDIAGDWESCALYYPPPTESSTARDSIGLVSLRHSTEIPAPASLQSGQWADVVLQLFPDGRCGVAIDSRVIAVTRPANERLSSVLLSIFGNSVGTRIQVGELQVSQGVAAEFDTVGGTRRDQIRPTPSLRTGRAPITDSPAGTLPPPRAPPPPRT